MAKKKNEIILFEDGNVKLEVNMHDETVWLTREQMIHLFGRDQSVISRHIKKVFEEKNWMKKAICKKCILQVLTNQLHYIAWM